ncbi:TldD protein, part of TldE/TldD proteolytic complex [hydrothermal vent metagenome]|uniref:TldD protein, part of TldE/TldD proteolytic complex n=1 Tax=hydrothermal vent metagenome TaxID=652676 RepID=A0A1W1BQF9_9ZZZZ
MLEKLLEYKLNKNTIYDLVADSFNKEIDYSDIYFQHSISESWILNDGIIKEGSYNINSGVGIRAIKNDQTGFAYTDGFAIKDIQQAINFAKGISKSSELQQIQSFESTQPIIKFNALNPLDSITALEKISILKNIDSFARLDKRVKQVSASLVGNYSKVLITASDGTFVEDFRPMVRLSISVVVEQNGRVETASSGGGGRYDYRYFIDNQLDRVWTTEALRQAEVSLKSKPAPAGSMPVVLASGWPGVLLHEAVGHGLEGDFNRKKTSVFTDKVGEKVASELCTIVDNGTIANRRGSLNVDDEGVPTQNTTLIENGVLKAYMQDKLNARLMGVEPTGNGRRESYAYLPIPRMTNTYMLSGTSKLNDMISSVEKGIYAVNFDGGQVDITSGKFVFSSNEAYLIENGEIKHPIKGATLIGSGDEVMHNVEMVGDDLRLDTGIGVCGKDGQSVPVGVGQPSLKISSLTVGGTEV